MIRTRIEHIDHFVLTVKNIDRTVRFYTEVLGMDLIEFGNGRKAISFGNQKINLHETGKEYSPNATHPTPGSADFCLISESSIEDVITELKNYSVPLVEGPVTKSGAQGKITSVYVRDPDDNLVEISNY